MLQNLEEHEENCGFMLIECPNKHKGCGIKFPKQNLQSHLREKCEFVQIQCEECETYLIRGKKPQHSCLEIFKEKLKQKDKEIEELKNELKIALMSKEKIKLRGIEEIKQLESNLMEVGCNLFRIRPTIKNNVLQEEEKLSKINKMSKITVFVATNTGKKLSFQIELHEQIKSLKEKIFSKLKLPNEIQKFLYNGRILCDKNTFYDYNIHNNGCINLIINSYGVQIGEDLVVYSYKTIQDVKEQIAKQKNIPIENQRLLLYDNELTNDIQIKNLPPLATLKLEKIDP